MIAKFESQIFQVCVLKEMHLDVIRFKNIKEHAENEDESKVLIFIRECFCYRIY